MVARSSRAGADGRAGLLATSIAGLLLLLGIGSAQAATLTVGAVNFEFQPASQAVKTGDVVRWTFAGEPHTVTSGTPGAPDGRFDSGIKNPGESFQVTFDAAGTYRYFCQIHPEQMIGTIVVRASTEPTPSPTAKPTPKPTAKPTPRPTARPTTKPTAAPTVAPTVAPTAAPTPSAAASIAPPSASPAATPSGSPTASSSAVGAVPPSAAPSAGPGAGEATAGVDPVPIVVGIAVLGLLVVGGLALARRSRGAAEV